MQLPDDISFSIIEFLPTSKLFDIYNEKEICNYIRMYSNHKRIKDIFRFASKKNKVEVIRYILENNYTDVDVNVDNGSPLFLAASYGSIESVKLLLEHGADPELRNYDAFLFARNLGQTEIINEIAKYIPEETKICSDRFPNTLPGKAVEHLVKSLK